MLIAAGAPLEHRNVKNSNNALHTAAMNGRLDIVKYLVAAGSKVDAWIEGAPNERGMTALAKATMNGHTEVSLPCPAIPRLTKLCQGRRPPHDTHVLLEHAAVAAPASLPPPRRALL